jgi:hypothetical protein
VSNGDYRAVAGRIKQELTALEAVAARVCGAWAEAALSPGGYNVDAAALNLHGFYAGLERVFLVVAERIDESVPSGASWHQELLRQMAVELPDTRPAVISERLAAELDRYRGFRHVVRNVYAYVLDAHRVGELVESLPPTLARLRAELTEFAEVLDEIAQG